MTKRKGHKSARNRNQNTSNAPKIILTKLFVKEFDDASNEIKKIVNSSLIKLKEGGLFAPGRKFKPLRIYKGKKIWYFRANRSLRITAAYDKAGNIYLLSIENHDTLDYSHKKIFRTMSDYEI